MLELRDALTELAESPVLQARDLNVTPARGQGVLLLQSTAEDVPGVQCALGSLGLALPRVGHVSHAGAGTVLSVAPGEWIFHLAEGQMRELEEEIRARIAAQVAFVTDLTHASGCLELRGAGASRLLASGCSLELRGFTAGAAARTLFAEMSVILWSRSGRDFFLLADRSLCDYLWKWIALSASVSW